jgi:hypothetical protein
MEEIFMSMHERERMQNCQNFTIRGIYRYMREFMRRRHGGISTAELNPLRGDTLGNWRERPPELDKETKPRFLASRFTLWKKDESWLVFVRSYYRFELPHPNRSSRIIHNPKKDFWRNFRRQRTFPPLHRLSDYIAVNRQTGEIRRFVDVATNEVIDDLLGIRPAPAQAELAKFWGKRKPNGIREKTREHFYR